MLLELCKDALTRTKDGTPHWGFRDPRTRKQYAERRRGTSSKEVLHLEEQGGGGKVTEGHVREVGFCVKSCPLRVNIILSNVQADRNKKPLKESHTHLYKDDNIFRSGYGHHVLLAGWLMPGKLGPLPSTR